MSELRKYNFEAKGLVFANEDYDSALEMNIYLMIVNQLDCGFDVQNTLFGDTTVELYASWFQSVNYTRIAEACEKLLKRNIKFIDQNKDFDIAMPFIRAKSGKGKIKITLKSEFVPYFLELKKGYSKYLFSEALALKTLRTKKIFRMLSSYPERTDNIWEISLENFKTLIKTEGYDGKPKMFIDRILQPAIDEIIEKTSLDIVFRADKKRGETLLRFEVLLKGVKENNMFPMTEKQNNAFQKLISWGVYSNIAKDFVQNNCDEFWKWHYTIQDQIGTKIKKPGAVFLKHFNINQK